MRKSSARIPFSSFNIKLDYDLFQGKSLKRFETPNRLKSCRGRITSTLIWLRPRCSVYGIA
jgi:hypothetical protein